LIDGTASLSCSRHLPTSSGKRRDNPVRYWIANSTENDRNSRRRLLGGKGGDCTSGGQDDVDLERNQFGRESGELLDLPFGIPVFDHDVATLDVPEVTQPLEEGVAQVGASG